MKTTLTALAFILVPVTVSAQVTVQTIITAFTNALGGLVVVAAAIALMVFIWGIVLFVARSGDENAVQEGKKRMMWGVIGLFLIVSIWGLINLLMEMFGVEDPATECQAPYIDISGKQIETCDL